MASTQTPPTTLSAAQQASYHDQGYLIVRGLLDAADLATCTAIHREATAQGRAELAAGGVKRGLDWERESDLDGLPVLRKVDQPFVRFEAFRRIFTRRRVLGVVHDLLGSPELYYHSSKMMCKPPRVGRRKPWHQDYAYWSDMQPQQLTLWVAIDAATRENGCVQVIPGSHQRGLIPHEQLEDWQIREDGIEQETIVHAEMAPGDALFFDVLTLHASDPNRSDASRLSAIIDYDANPRGDGQRSGFGATEALQPSDG
jgi:phytanoyl-CoA hydroxylase